MAVSASAMRALTTASSSAARALAASVTRALAAAAVERDEARAEVERLTAERDTARAEVQRLIAERDQPESRPKGREVGRFGLDGHYLNAMEPTRPTDEDIWREAFMRQLHDDHVPNWATTADLALAEYRKRWPR